MAIAALALLCREASALDCAVSSLATVLDVFGARQGGMPTPEALGLSGAPPFTFLALKQAAATHGVALEGRECTLEQALAFDGPVILALEDPDHFVVALNQGGSVAQLVDGSQFAAAQPADLQPRFRGVALFPVVPEAPGPRVQVSEPHVDAGVVGLGERVVHSFDLQNVGDALLQVEAPGGLCCGLTAALDAETVAAGETAHLIVGVTLTQSGPAFRSFRLRTSDPRRRVLFLSVAATTPPGIEVRPEALQLLADRGVTAKPPSARVAVHLTPGVRVAAVASVEGMCEPRVGEVWEVWDGVDTTIIVPARVDLVPGTHRDEVTIQTEGALATSMRVPVTIVVRPNAVCTPTRAFFGFVPQGEAVSAIKVTVATRRSVPFRILGARTSDPRITLVSAPSTENPVCEVTVATADLGLVVGNVIVTTDIPLEEELTIPVHALVIPR